ncbi:MAG TPA: antibiotic biosynthesis monooxygenase, partial [Leucothrix sp.]|nr:antibiotic biosynthesis monooxygenase [Leucothrix sp.]
MILEVAILNVISGKEAEFELAFNTAEKIISRMKGYISHQLQQSIEVPNRYILLVNWKTLEDHTVGFKK